LLGANASESDQPDQEAEKNNAKSGRKYCNYEKYLILANNKVISASIFFLWELEKDRQSLSFRTETGFILPCTVSM
jgi:hypothetical protein